MHRFYIEQKLKIDDEIKLSDEAARQVAQVLRMRAGDEIVLFNGDGFDYLAVLAAVGKKEVRAKIITQTENTREPKIALTLFQALIKKDKMEWVAEKCTEIGVAKIAPVIAERSVKTGLNEARLQKILKEAAEQSGRATVPALDKIATFENALKTAIKECEIVYLAHLPTAQGNAAQAGDKSNRSWIPAHNASRKIALFVGPEGGFSDAEIRTAEALGAKIISLGSTILRAETAAVCGAYRLLDTR